jgi:protein phosphatase
VRIRFGALSHPGRVRPNNEDHYMIVRRSRSRQVLATNLPDGVLGPANEAEAFTLALADGMGGMDFGELASQLALRIGWDLGAQEIEWPLQVNADVAREVMEKFEAYAQLIHRALQAQGKHNPKLAGMGTTLTVAYTVGLDAFIGHLGDSRAYLFRQGVLAQLTSDHTLAQHLVDTGAFASDALELRRLRHVLVNCLGGGQSAIRVEVQHLALLNGDSLLLCSDGLTDMVSDSQIARTLAQVSVPQDACQALVEQALEAGGKDNVTVVLARYQQTNDQGQVNRPDAE